MARPHQGGLASVNENYNGYSEREGLARKERQQIIIWLHMWWGDRALNIERHRAGYLALYADIEMMPHNEYDELMAYF